MHSPAYAEVEKKAWAKHYRRFFFLRLGERLFLWNEPSFNEATNQSLTVYQEELDRERASIREDSVTRILNNERNSNAT